MLTVACNPKDSPPIVVVPPTPIHMTARELYLDYDSSARVLPATYYSYEDRTWIEAGDPVQPGATYILPVPRTEGMPSVELRRLADETGGETEVGEVQAVLSTAEDQTYQLSDIAFWRIRIEFAQLPDNAATLHLSWTAHDVDGQPLTFHQYYRILR